jgi:hypothetical protein
MAISRVQGVIGANGSTATLGAAVTSGDFVVGFVSWFFTGGATDLVSVTTDKGDTATLLDPTADSTNGGASALFYFPSVTSGAKIFTANWGSSGVTSWQVVVDEFSGVATSSPLDGTAHTNGKHGTVSGVITTNAIVPVVNGDLIYAYFFDETGVVTTQTAGSGYTIANNDNVALATEWQVQSTAASISASLNATGGGTNLAGLAAFKAAGLGGAASGEYSSPITRIKRPAWR